MADQTLASAYAALLLHDAGVTVTAANISTLLKTAKLTANSAAAAVVESALKNVTVDVLVGGALGGSGSAAAPAAASVAAPAAKTEAPKVEERKINLVKNRIANSCVIFIFSYQGRRGRLRHGRSLRLIRNIPFVCHPYLHVTSIHVVYSVFNELFNTITNIFHPVLWMGKSESLCTKTAVSYESSLFLSFFQAALLLKLIDR